MALTFAVLQALTVPATVDELARRLDMAAPHLQSELERLERRGYVQRVACDSHACGWCGLKAGCLAVGGERWLRV